MNTSHRLRFFTHPYRFYSAQLPGSFLIALIAALSAAVCGGAVADTKASVTFGRDVAPILYSQCAPCHRQGEVAPFTLTSYEDARKRARQIAEITARRVMPPWQPEPGYGAFQHERRLTDAQIKTLAQWAAQGMPQGDASAAPPPPYKDGWQLGKPDLILKMPQAYTIPAEGKDVNRGFVLPVHLPADRYIRAAEFRPGNRRVVHHATLMLDSSGKARQMEERQGGLGKGYTSSGSLDFVPAGGLPGYAPGMGPEIYPADASGVLPKNIDVVFGMHYHPTGKVETDQSCIGLYFTDKPPVRIGSLITMAVLHLDIAAGERAHPEQDAYTLPVDVDVEAIYEHMHLIGKGCKLWADLPDHTTRPLIKINDWDFNWQATYHVKERVHLPKGTVIHAQWTHDNSADNIHNPNNPPKRIQYGENSTDEMAGVLINVYVNNPVDNGVLWLTNLGHLAGQSLRPAAHSKVGAKDTVGGWLLRQGVYGVTDQAVDGVARPGFLLCKDIAGGLIMFYLPCLSALGLPRVTRKTSKRLRSAPWWSLFTGLALWLVLPLPALALLFAANSLAQGVGVLMFLTLMALCLIGMGGWTRCIAVWLAGKSSGAGRSDRASEADGTGKFSLLCKATLCLCFACLLPIAGWFGIAPLMLILGVGASARGLFSGRRSSRSAAPAASLPQMQRV